MSEKIDEEILDILRRDARTPIADIARQVGRSRTAIKVRVAKLERSKRILNYTITEPSVAETDGIGAIVLVAMEVRHQTKDFLDYVSTAPQIASCVGVIGKHDYALLIRQIDKSELENILVRIFKIKGVKSTETIMTLFREF